MKIVVAGDPNRLHKIVRFECKMCGCIFDADERDYQYTEHKFVGIDFLDTIAETFPEYSCSCPFCTNECYSNANMIQIDWRVTVGTSYIPSETGIPMEYEKGGAR